MKKREVKRIVMTGPTGAVGMAIIKECIKRGISMLLITREDSARNDRIPRSKYISILYADITEYDGIDVAEEIEGFFDAFIHLAWAGTIGDGRNDMELQSDNIKYTLSAVRLAKRLGCRVFLGAGSQAEYGRVEGYLNSKTPAFPENGYGMAKLCAGQMSRGLCEQLEMEHIWIRILSIYGPCDGEKTLISTAIRGFLKEEKVSFTAGEQEWDYLFSEDAAVMIIDLLEKGNHGKTYCLGSGKERSLREYIRDIHYEIRKMEVKDDEIGIGHLPYNDKQVMFLCADTKELQTDIGALRLTPFKEGIKKTIEWYKREGI